VTLALILTAVLGRYTYTLTAVLGRCTYIYLQFITVIILTAVVGRCTYTYSL